MSGFRQSCENKVCQEIPPFLPMPGDEFQCKELLSVDVKGFIDDYQMVTVLKMVTERKKDWSIVNPINFFYNCTSCVKRFITARLSGSDEVVLVPITNNSHWVLVVVTKTNVLYYNSFGGASIIEPARSLLEAFGDKFVTLHPGDVFQKQKDGFNCGIFVIKSAETLATGKRWNSEKCTPSECRRQIIEKLSLTYECQFGPGPVLLHHLNKMCPPPDNNRDQEEDSIDVAQLLFGKTKSVVAMLAEPIRKKWMELSTIGAQMKIESAKGHPRSLNPPLVYNIDGLDAKKKYSGQLLLQPIQNGQVGTKKDVKGTVIYEKEISLGEELSFKELSIWNNQNAIDSNVMKLTNNTTYQPILQIYETSSKSETLVSTIVIKETIFETKGSPNEENVAIRAQWRNASGKGSRKRMGSTLQQPVSKRVKVGK